jgi:hypothetical protein
MPEEVPVRRTLLRLLLALACALALALGVAGCSVNGTLRLPTGVVYPSIEPVTGAADQTVTHTFRFEGKERAVTVTVNGPLLAGARAAEKSVIRFGHARENDWIEDYYPAFIFEQHQDAFFAALLGQLRGIRDTEGLDSDRYVELMTVFAQSIEYRIDESDLSPKFPVETFADRNGDCDDKTLLLGALLAREGYDVAILLFAAEQHVALGIKANGLQYRDTGYAFIEATTPGFVGMAPDSVGSGTLLESAPQVFPLEGGDTAFGAADQVATIEKAAADLEARAAALGSEIATADTRLGEREAKVRGLQARMDALETSGDSAAYNALVPDYNAAADAFNAAVVERNNLVSQHNAAVEAHTYILEHLDDRPGTFEYLRTHAR